jgi:hypothetical protein
MWKVSKSKSNSEKIKFHILKEDEIISVSEFISGLKESEAFRTFYNSMLIDNPFTAFFRENKPMTFDSLVDDYEFCIVNGEELNRVAYPETFAEHFKTSKLIVSCPVQDHSHYTHLGKFVRSSSKNQIDNFWKKVGGEMLNHVSDNPKWLSTAGMGVYWPHARIDSCSEILSEFGI